MSDELIDAMTEAHEEIYRRTARDRYKENILRCHKCGKGPLIQLRADAGYYAKKWEAVCCDEWFHSSTPHGAVLLWNRAQRTALGAGEETKG